MSRRWHCSLIALATLSGMAAFAAAQTTVAPPPDIATTATVGPFGPQRPLAQIPAPKLAKLRELAAILFQPDKARTEMEESLASSDTLLLQQLERAGLSPTRAQDFASAWKQDFSARFTATLQPDYLIPVLDSAYSEEQVGQLVAFYNTPLGKLLENTGPQIAEATIAHYQQMGAQLGSLAAHDITGSFPELNKDSATAAPGELPRPAEVKTRLYPPVGQARADLAAAEKRAAADGHRVLVIFGGNWCYDCHVLHAALDSPAYASLAAAYEQVDVNVGDAGMDNLDLARELGVDTSKGVPALAVLDATGKVLTAQKQGEFQDTRALQGVALADFLKAWQRP